MLLYGEESFQKRYTSFRNKVKGFGISAISEILSMTYPDKFCIWNDKTKNVLTFLNLKKNLRESCFKNNYITGEEYTQYINYLLAIKSELLPYQINNFIDLDAFFWYVHENVIPQDWRGDSILDYEGDKENELLEKEKSIELEELIRQYDRNRDFFGKRKITEKGKQILNQNPTKIDNNYLKQFPEFVQFQIGKKKKRNLEVKKM